MKKQTPHQYLLKAIEYMQVSKHEFAHLVGLAHAANITNWMRRESKIPLEIAFAVDSLTNGYVRVHDLRPDFIFPRKVKKKAKK